MLSMRIVAISDVHGKYKSVTLPDGDLLVVAGDCLSRGTITELVDFNEWLGTLPHKHKIVIAGNHDETLQHMTSPSKFITNASYLRDQEIVIEGKRIYGTPWTPTYGHWAFMASEAVLSNHFLKIPSGLDLLITHGPPHTILDLTLTNERAGGRALYEAVKRANPRYHVFGHIHEGYGKLVIADTTFLNVSTCTRAYQPTNPPVVFDI